MNRNQLFLSVSISSIAFFWLYFIKGDYFISAVGVSVWLFTFIMYIKSLGHSLPILELILFIASSQWILGAYIEYRLDNDHYKYYMYVDEIEYMSIVVPGMISYIIGVNIFYPKVDFEKLNNKLKEYIKGRNRLAYIILVIGFIASVINRFLPESLNFIFFLISNFKYIGVSLLLFNPESKSKWWVMGGIMLLTFISSVNSGMFHDLLLWSALMLSFVVLNFKMNFVKRMSLVLGGLFFAFLIQSVKSDIREVVWRGGNRDAVSLFFNLVDKRLSNWGDVTSDESLTEINVRLNQGWIISAIIDNVPKWEPYANGETILSALQSSLMPRFLYANKSRASGRDNFMRFTGLYLNEGTAMGISLFGEGYANFGKLGSWIFMFIWGLFISFVFGKIIGYEKYNIIIVFVPLIFLQVIKAESEVMIMLNHFLKASILVFVFLWVGQKTLKI